MHGIILNAMTGGSEQSDDDLVRFRASSVSSSHRGHRPRSSSATVTQPHHSAHHIGADQSFSRPRRSNASDIGRSSGTVAGIHRPNSSSGMCSVGTGSGQCERSRTTSECGAAADEQFYCDFAPTSSLTTSCQKASSSSQVCFPSTSAHNS